jgi:hypothetical protein
LENGIQDMGAGTRVFTGVTKNALIPLEFILSVVEGPE